ncbi:centrosomal protein of 83 kDa-like isoform X1 [Festucalex cinctus]
MEVQHVLADLQKKCETYKSNYNDLKNEHSRLQDELAHAQGEAKRLHGQQNKLQSQLAAQSRELLDKNRETDELRLQVMTPMRLEVLRAQVQQELEAPAREHFAKLEEEAEKYRSEFNKLRYAYTVLNSQFEHQKEEHVGALERQKMRSDVEIAHLKKEKENLEAQYKNVDPSYEKKEKTQLAMLLKGLRADVDELQATKENSDQQADNIQLARNRQLTESQAAVKSLQSERRRRCLRLERVEGQLHLSQEQNKQITGQLHTTQREVSALTCQVERLKLSHEAEADNVKLEFARSKGEVERERDSLRGQKESRFASRSSFSCSWPAMQKKQKHFRSVASGLQTEVAVLKDMLERRNQILIEKEMEMVRKVKSACDEETCKTAALLQEKMDLEQRLMEFEKQNTMQDINMQSQKGEWQHQLGLAHKREESVRKELQGLKTKLKEQSVQLEELEKQNVEVIEKNQQLSRSEAELTEANDRLREKLSVIRCGAERLLEDRKQREAKLEEKCSQLKDKLHRRRDKEEKKEQSLHRTIQTLRKQIDELKQDDALVKKKLLDYQQRHNDFRRLLMCKNGSFSAGRSQMTSTCRPALFRGSEMLSEAQGQEEDEEQRELTRIRQRVDDLDKIQQRQMEELGCIEQK